MSIINTPCVLLNGLLNFYGVPLPALVMAFTGTIIGLGLK